LQYLLPIRSLLLRIGMSLLLGGILGNVTDRILWGYVVDFILLGSPQGHTPVFNLADSVQLAGYGMIVLSLFRDGEILWPANNARRKYWVNPGFQIRYSMILVSVGLGFALVAGVFCYTYLRVTMIDLIGQNTRVLDQFLVPFVITFALLALGFAGMLFILGKILSHRMAGPLYAFEKYLEDLIAGQSRQLRLRAGDEFRHLEEVADQLAQKFEELRSLDPNQKGETNPAISEIASGNSQPKAVSGND
jgi:signal peptidase II